MIMLNKKIAVAGVSLSEAYALSENHPLSETLTPLSELGESGGESAMHLCAQCVIISLSESFVSSHAKHAELAQPNSTNSRLAQKWR